MRTIRPEQDPGGETEDRGASPGDAQNRRLPFWLGVLLLLAGLLIFLGGMHWLISQPVGAPATPVATAEPAAAPTSAVVAPAPTSVPAPTPLPTAAPATVPTIAPTQAQTPVATTLPTVEPTPQPTTAPTIEPTLATALSTSWWTWQSDQINPAEEQQVLAAVDLSWQVLGEAWWNLDPGPLGQALADPFLTDVTDSIVARQPDGRASAIDVDRSRTEVRFIDNDTAVVYEEYVDHSTAIDIATRQPLEQSPSEVYKDFELLRKIDGTWKIASGVREP
jgi:hypothetical protein